MPSPSLPGIPSTLVGRDRELGVLRDHLAAARAERGSLVLIGGEAGIGKTALAEAVCREAEGQGALVLIGRCFDLSETPPYGPWVELFARFHTANGDPPLPTAFARRGTVGAVMSQAALFQQVLDFFIALSARRPLVLLLDDAHWMDPASLDLLRVLARSLAPHPLLLLITSRMDEPTRRQPLHRLLPLLVREASATRLILHPLATEDTATLVRARFALPDADTARLVAYLAERAEGNPFFISELLQTLEEEAVLRPTDSGWALGPLTDVGVPPLLRQVIEARIARFDAESQRLLGVAAVIGADVPLSVWAAVGEVDEDALLDLTERGEEARLLAGTPDGESAHFAHALIRETLYEGIPGIQRRRIHRQVGETLAALPHPDPDAVAFHFERSHDARAASWLLAAGERAQRAYAWLTAADRYEASLALTGDAADVGARGWLLLRLAICRRFALPDQVLSYLGEAAAAAGAAGDAMLLARARIYQGLTRCYLGDLPRGIAEMRAGVAAQEALAAAGQQYTPLDAVDATNGRGTLADFLANAGQFAEARALADAHLAAAPPSPEVVAAAPYADTYMAIGIVDALLGRPEEAHAHFRHAAAIYRRAGHHHIVVRVMVNALHYVRLTYEADRVEDRRREAEELAAAVAGLVETVKVRESPEATQTGLLMLEGRWAEIHAVVAHLDESASSMVATVTETQGCLALAQGDEATALALIGRWMPDGPTTAPGSTFFTTSISMIRVAAARALDVGDGQRARAWLEAHDRWLTWSGAVLGQSEGQALWARYYRQAGDRDNARDHAERALAHASEPRQPVALLAAHRLLGELHTDAGRYDDAARHVDASLSLAEACQAPYERALTLLARAGLHAASGNATEAVTVLDQARAICTILGAMPALARIAALAASLPAAGAGPLSPAGMTQREMEVLRQIATGKSNREIAMALSVSVRTVERHIENLYRKIDARSKADATAYAFRHHLA
jgi:DNA-binding CsgD family transcriptional regulator